MYPLLVALLLSLAGPAAHADALSVFRLVRQLNAEGQRNEHIEGLISYALKHEGRGTTEGPHQVDYVTVYGHESKQGFNAEWMSLVWEDWSTNAAGNSVVDQWIRNLSLEEALTSVRHARIEITPDHMVVNLDVLPTGPAESEAEQAAATRELGVWYDRLSIPK